MGIQCPTVNKGRIARSTSPMVDLVTLQPGVLLNQLQRRGEIRRSLRSFPTTIAKETGLPRSHSSIKEMINLYAWMSRQMARLGVPTEEGCWPFWAWHRSAAITPTHEYGSVRKDCG